MHEKVSASTLLP